MSATPVVRCPLRACSHPINDHHGELRGTVNGKTAEIREGCTTPGEHGTCPCRLTPNTIAVALLFGDLSEPSRVTRKPNGSWD